MKKLLCALMSLSLLLSLTACGGTGSNPGGASSGNTGGTDAPAGSKVYELKCSTFVNSGSPEMELINDFVNKIAERTDNHVIIKVHAGESLGGYEQTFEETMRGTIEFGINSVGYSFDNRLTASSIPAMMDSFETAEKVLAPGATLPSLYDEVLDNLGLKFLAFYPGGFYNICLNVDVPDGYADPNVPKSTVIRVPVSEVVDRAITSLNWHTASLPGSELYTGLETGIVDGCIGLDYAFINSGFSDVLKNIVENRAMMSCDSIFMNKALFESMPAEYQQAIEECAIEFQQTCIDHQREIEESIKPELEAKGIHIVELTPEEVQSNFDKLREDVWPWCAEQYGQEFMDGLMADING